MNPVLLLTHFHRLAGAPGAVSRLRRFILDLAVRGKLVPQNPEDEPAAELLKRIQAVRERLAGEGEIKRLEHFHPVTENEVSFSIPASWKVTRLGWLVRKLGAGSTPLGGKSVYQREGVPFLRSQNVHNDGLRLDDVALIARGIHERMSGTHVHASDLLLNITGASIGRCAVVPENFIEGNVSQHVAIVRLIAPELCAFIHLSLIAPFFQKLIDDVQVGVSREGLSMQRLRLFPMLIPPLAEQQRIVAKVDELMALCDRLEEAHAETELRRERLAAATHAGLAAPSSDPAPASFFIRHFSRLAIRPEQIPLIRQTVLNLAVMGRLVSQSLDDEPAEKIVGPAKSASVQQTNSSSQPTKLSAGWIWAKFGDLCSLVTSGSRGWAEYYSDSGPKFIRAQNIRFGRLLLDGLACVNLPAKTEGSRTSVSRGDILIVITGAGVTNPGMLEEDIGEAYVSQHVGLAKPKSIELSPWMLLCLMAPNGARRELVERAYGAGKPGLNLPNIRTLRIPLPPLAEQKRIVAKVDELMALCDRLETQLSLTETENQRLLESVLHHSLAA